MSPERVCIPNPRSYRPVGGSLGIGRIRPLADAMSFACHVKANIGPRDARGLAGAIYEVRPRILVWFYEQSLVCEVRVEALFV
jgi:hypothetical protein